MSQSVPPVITVIPVTVTETKDKDKTMARTPAARKPPAAAKPPTKAEAFKPAAVDFYYPGYEKFGNAFLGLAPWVDFTTTPVVNVGFAYLGWAPTEDEQVRVLCHTAKNKLAGVNVSPADQAKAKARAKVLIEQVREVTSGSDPGFEAWFALWKASKWGQSKKLDQYGVEKGTATLGDHIEKVRRRRTAGAATVLSPAAAKFFGATTLPTRPSSVPKNFRRKTEGSEGDKAAEAEQAKWLTDFFGK